MTEPLSEFGVNVHERSVKAWGLEAAVHLVGRSSALLEVQKRLTRFVRIESPVLLTGESGVGKELFAKSLYLLSRRCGRPFLSINCAQYQNEELLVSEIFGHKKGSFTGAITDHPGLFDAADDGILFLDEVGELSPRAQAMLLRALSEGEIKPLGGTRVTKVNVRVVAATNRPLRSMVSSNTFREDLYYRLHYFHIEIPPIRARDDDWRLLADHFLTRSNSTYADSKRFSEPSLSLLEAYDWPGNVREIQSIVDVGFCLSEGPTIEPHDIQYALDSTFSGASETAKRGEMIVDEAYQLMLEEGRDFWHVVREPFLDREMNRSEVRAIVKRGLTDSRGSYKRLLEIFRVEQDDYLKFMDFLRHHRLKPDRL